MSTEPIAHTPEPSDAALVADLLRWLTRNALHLCTKRFGEMQPVDDAEVRRLLGRFFSERRSTRNAP